MAVVEGQDEGVAQRVQVGQGLLQVRQGPLGARGRVCARLALVSAPFLALVAQLAKGFERPPHHLPPRSHT